MKFDVIVGNPPYGTQSGTAVKFLNKCARLSDYIVFVLPRSFEKAHRINQIDPLLHLRNSVPLHPRTYPKKKLRTCWQVWVKEFFSRPKILRKSVHPDFRSVPKDQADLCILLRGCNAGKIIRRGGFDQYKETHLYLRTSSPEVQERLLKIEPKLRESSLSSVAVPCISRADVVEIYASAA